MKKLFSVAVLFLLIFTLTSCTKKTFIPLENNFKLTYKLSNPVPKLGDEIEVTSILENTSYSDFYFSGSNPMSEILIYKLNDPNFTDVIVGTGLGTTFKGHEKHLETKKLLIDKPGKYKITINSRFTINMIGSNNQGYAEYNLKTEPIEFEIK